MNYQRNLESSIVQKLNQPEAIFIFGPRQSGKTTLMRQLIQRVGEDSSLYFDLEYPDALGLFSQSFDEIIKHLRFVRKSGEGRVFVFIDEVQYLGDISKFVKLMVDHHSAEFKLIMTGSSSALIKHQFRDSLVGRKLIYELYPLSFDEFLLFKGEDKLAAAVKAKPKNIPGSLRRLLEKYLEEFIIFGSYPKVVKAQTIDEKWDILKDIAGSCILKDIRDLFRIEKPQQLNHLVKALCVNIGKELNINSLSNEVGLHRETTKSYLDILEECYVIRRLKPFYSNMSTELRKMNKQYFVDTGIRNVMINNLNYLSGRADKGELLENAVHGIIHRNLPSGYKLRYWQTRNRQEIDFVILGPETMIAIETKYSQARTSSFLAFSKAYPGARCKVVSFQSAESGMPVWELPALMTEED